MRAAINAFFIVAYLIGCVVGAAAWSILTRFAYPGVPYQLVVQKMTPELLAHCRQDNNCMDVTTFGEE